MGRKGKVDLSAKREVGKKERRLLRTGKLNKAERRIVLLREERNAAGKAEETPPAAQPKPELPAAVAPAPSDPEAWPRRPREISVASIRRSS